MITADVVVLGAGVIGASVAHHLTALGRTVVLVDRASGPGQGSTGRATGGYRAQFDTELNVRLSLRSREKLLSFKDETGVDPGYQQVGYLWLADDEPTMAQLRRGLEVQRAAGVEDVFEVGPGDLQKHNPSIRIEGLVGGTFCPSDGYIRPLKILEGYLQSAERAGAKVLWNAEVKAMHRDDSGRILQLETTQGSLCAPTYVNAAGAWAAQIAAMAGVQLPVTPLRRQVALTEPTAVLPTNMPMTLWARDGFHLRVRDGRVLLLMPSPEVPGEPFSTRVDADWIEQVTKVARERLPVLKDVQVDVNGCWAGLYEMTADGHAIVGALEGCPNLVMVNGSSGHGVMHSPALGEIVARLV
jgi:sarcosine oxidase subunit beta